MESDLLQDRLRHFVGGRVLVFTTSRFVDFVDHDQKTVVPLFSFPSGFDYSEGLSFMVELDGYLVYERGTEMVVHEMQNFKNGYFDAAAGSLTYKLPPYRIVVDEVVMLDMVTDAAGVKTCQKVLLTLTAEVPGATTTQFRGTVEYRLAPVRVITTLAQADELSFSFLGTYKFRNGYPGAYFQKFTPI